MEFQPDLTTIIQQMVLAVVNGRFDQIKDDLTKQILVENKPFLKIDDVVELTGLKKSSVYNAISQGLISYYRPNNKHVYFRLQDVENFIFNQKHYHKSIIELKQEALGQYLNLKKGGKMD
jgi:predicted DNA-binding transcriptional regulator AlpA